MLREQWPKIPGWEPQAEEMLRYLDDLLHDIPVITYANDIRVRVTITAKPQAPVYLPEAREPTVFAGFDATKGILHRRILEATGEQPPALDDIAVATGMLVICQPFLMVARRWQADRYLLERPLVPDYLNDFFNKA